MHLFGKHHHNDDNPLADANSVEIELFFLGVAILTELEKIMPAIDDLKAVIADLRTELLENNAEIEALLVKMTTPGTSDADIAAAVADIRSSIAENKTEVDKAKAATV